MAPTAQQWSWEQTRKISAWARITFRKEKPSTGLGRGERGGELIFFFPTENSLFSLLSSDSEIFALAPDAMARMLVLPPHVVSFFPD